MSTWGSGGWGPHPREGLFCPPGEAADGLPEIDVFSWIFVALSKVCFVHMGKWGLRLQTTQLKTNQTSQTSQTTQSTQTSQTNQSLEHKRPDSRAGGVRNGPCPEIQKREGSNGNWGPYR